MLYFLKIALTLITATLGVLSVKQDFLEKETHKLKPTGKWYITFFLVAAILTFVLDELSDTEKEKRTRKNFTGAIIAISDSFLPS